MEVKHPNNAGCQTQITAQRERESLAEIIHTLCAPNAHVGWIVFAHATSFKYSQTSSALATLHLKFQMKY